MLRQAAEDKESAIKMRAALQAELAQLQPRAFIASSSSAVATSQELECSRLLLQAWATAQVVEEVVHLFHLLHLLRCFPASFFFLVVSIVSVNAAGFLFLQVIRRSFSCEQSW